MRSSLILALIPQHLLNKDKGRCERQAECDACIWRAFVGVTHNFRALLRCTARYKMASRDATRETTNRVSTVGENV